MPDGTGFDASNGKQQQQQQKQPDSYMEATLAAMYILNRFVNALLLCFCLCSGVGAARSSNTEGAAGSRSSSSNRESSLLRQSPVRHACNAEVVTGAAQGLPEFPVAAAAAAAATAAAAAAYRRRTPDV